MSATVLALVVSIVGVGGTLASAVLSQVLSMRAKRVELDGQRQQRRDERAEEQRRTDYTDRRSSCVAVNMAARRFRQALKNYLFEGTDEKADELERARQEFTSRYGEAQMILPDAVLSEASAASSCLAQAYGKVKAFRRPDGRLAVHGLAPGADRDKLELFLDGDVAAALRQLRHAMRVDLGVAE
jgi:hypothetical protein